VGSKFTPNGLSAQVSLKQELEGIIIQFPANAEPLTINLSTTDAKSLSDNELVAQIEDDAFVPRSVIDEYYRRCIPLYLDFLGIHWHTGFYQPGDAGISARDQVRMIDHIASLIDIDESDRVLDVGCGIGATSCHLNLSRGCEVIGLTPVAKQRELALQLAGKNNAAIQIDIGHAEELPYADNSFDAVVFFESPCHFENRLAFFSEVERVLRPGGRIAGEDWLATNLSNNSQRDEFIEPICKTWAIPMLGDANEYLNLMRSVNLSDISIVDMQTLMPLHKGFAVNQEDLTDLEREIKQCTNPLLALTLKGLVRLGKAVNAGAFTIGQISAIKPGR